MSISLAHSASAARNLRAGQAAYAIARRIDLTGVKCGRLSVIRRADNIGRRTAWICLCDCGREVRQYTEVLRSGRASSCGCLRIEQIRARSITHGASTTRIRTPEYRCWLSAKQRCFNPKSAKFASYGGRGITMCEQWRHNFSAFLADVGPRPVGMSLDRIDVNGHYAPGNCRWATAREQSNNTRSNRLVDAPEGRMTLKQYARLRGVDYTALHAQVKYRGADPIEAANKLLRG